MKRQKKILFVCLGNIVRSPLAENLFARLAEEAGTGEDYWADSAGTASYHVGESPDPRMRRVAAKHGLEYDGRARQFTSEDFDQYDLIVAMDGDNRAVLLGQAGKPEDAAKIRLLREFDPDGGVGVGVPDPYYGGEEGFEQVYGIVERSCRGLLEALEAGEV